MSATQDLESLRGLLGKIDRTAIAVSGGVDSMTLAVVAQRLAPLRTRIFHATSAAVPPLATARVRHFAERESWDLHVIDAGEFQDPSYRSNPADRCYFCKRGLYGGILQALDTGSGFTTLAGTNMDDLGDFRPGLRAAEEREVRHPFVEAAMTKAQVRAVAKHLDLHDLAELPAAPCLSSRVQTGLPIQPDQLQRIDRVEVVLRAALADLGMQPQAVRCRVLATGVELAIDAECLDALAPPTRARLLVKAQNAWGASHEPIKWSTYRMGQAFLPSEETRSLYAPRELQATLRPKVPHE
jgi:uncharacterized protein